MVFVQSFGFTENAVKICSINSTVRLIRIKENIFSYRKRSFLHIQYFLSLCRKILKRPVISKYEFLNTPSSKINKCGRSIITRMRICRLYWCVTTAGLGYLEVVWMVHANSSSWAVGQCPHLSTPNGEKIYNFSTDLNPNTTQLISTAPIHPRCKPTSR